MIKRCENPEVDRYPRYGGRGISVCHKWRVSYEAFLLDVGRRPSPNHSIHRINNDGNYEPGNVEWQTKKAQAYHTSRNVFVEINGIVRCISEWCLALGYSALDKKAIYERIRKGWDPKRAILLPVASEARAS